MVKWDDVATTIWLPQTLLRLDVKQHGAVQRYLTPTFGPSLEHSLPRSATMIFVP